MSQDKTFEELREVEGRDQSSLASPTKVLNVSVPKSVYWHIRSCASESRMSIKNFMAHFCRTATPINVTVKPSQSNTEPENANKVDQIQ